MEMRDMVSFTPVVITLTTEEEVTQLYSILNFTPIINVLNSGMTEWDTLRSFLNDRRGDYTPWQLKLEKKLKV